MVDLRHSFRGDEYLPAGDGGKDPAHRRILGVAEPYDQVVDPTKLPARAIDQVGTDNERKMQDTWLGCGRGLHRENDTAGALASAEGNDDRLKTLRDMVGCRQGRIARSEGNSHYRRQEIRALDWAISIIRHVEEGILADLEQEKDERIIDA